MFKEVNTSTFLHMQLKSYMTLCWYKSEIITCISINSVTTARKYTSVIRITKIPQINTQKLLLAEVNYCSDKL